MPSGISQILARRGGEKGFTKGKRRKSGDGINLAGRVFSRACFTGGENPEEETKPWRKVSHLPVKKE